MTTPAPSSITTWTRLEPRARGDSLAPALQARVYDPAWMLAMQRLLAEFRGQDAAFPIQVSYSVDTWPLAGYQPGATSAPYPLEAFAWPEPAAPMTPGASAESGAELLRLLNEQGCSRATTGNIIAAYPLAAPAPPAEPWQVTADQQGTAYLTLVAGRLPDTALLEPVLRPAIASGGSFPASLGIASQDVTAVTKAATQWLAGLDSFALSTPSAADPWQPSRLEHQFSVTAVSASATQVSLVASAWPGRRMEWSDFDVAPPPPVPLPVTPPALPGADSAPGTIPRTGPPHPLSPPGTPARRYWTFDDAHYNFAAVTASPDDLARMLIVEFASVYGNDWYMQLIPLPYGALHKITSLTVTNSFGESEDLSPVADAAADWCVFRQAVQSPGQPPLDGLLLVPAAADVQSSQAQEEVVLIRDDAADLGWAVEHTVTGADGRPLDRYAAAAQQAPEAPAVPPADDGSTVRYSLQGDVPVYCFPMVADASGQPVLDLLVMRRLGPDGQQHDVLPAGELLTAVRNVQLFDQELTTTGMTARRRWHLVRGFAGEPLLWCGRERATGGRYGSIPLEFDQITPSPGSLLPHNRTSRLFILSHVKRQLESHRMGGGRYTAFGT